MTVLLARARQVGPIAWAVVATVLGVAGLLLVAVFLRRRTAEKAANAVDDFVSNAWRAREVASARAVVQITAARTTEGAERDELQAILEDKDADRQADMLIAMKARLRGKM